MPFAIPTLADLRRQVRGFVAARSPGADAAIPNAPLRVVSDNQAGLAAGLYQYLGWISQQLLPDTAEDAYLDRHADIWVGGRMEASYATGEALFSGNAGTLIPAGEILISGDATYQTQSAAFLLGTPTSIPVEAITPGAVANRDPGTPLSLASAISGVDGSAIVVSMSGGVDVESNDHARRRVLERIRKPPMGGDADDYVLWTLGTPAAGSLITRVWCAGNEMGPGTVTVRFMMDDTYSDGLPQSADINAVSAYLDTKRPVTVRDLFVLGPISYPIDFAVSGLTPNTDAVKSAIAVSVSAMLHDRARPATSVGGVLVQAQTIYAAWIVEAVMSAVGIDHCTVTASDFVMPGNGYIATLGTISYA